MAKRLLHPSVPQNVVQILPFFGGWVRMERKAYMLRKWRPTCVRFSSRCSVFPPCPPLIERRSFIPCPPQMFPETDNIIINNNNNNINNIAGGKMTLHCKYNVK